MSQPYDPALKTLVEMGPADWLPLLGLPRKRVTIEDTDLATVVSGAVDKILRVHAQPEYLLHLDFQPGHDSAILPRRLRLYNGVLDYRHDRPGLSVAVLLRPEADSPQLTGLFQRDLAGQEPIALLPYRVIRVWQLPVEPVAGRRAGNAAVGPRQRGGGSAGAGHHPAHEGAIESREPPPSRDFVKSYCARDENASVRPMMPRRRP